MKNDDEFLMGLFMVLVAAALFLYGLALWAIVWFIISSIIGYLRYQKYLREAKEEFDELAGELGVDLPVVDILEMAGIEVPQEEGFETVGDWMAGTPLGVSEVWAS
jgi:hypothetical protein